KGLKLPDVPKAPQFPNFPGGFPNFPNFPKIEPGQFPNFPNFQPGQNPFQGGKPDGQKPVVAMNRKANGTFVGYHQLGDRNITVTGQAADNKANVKNIQVREGGKSTTYATVDEAPEALRDDIRNLIRMAENPPRSEKKE